MKVCTGENDSFEEKAKKCEEFLGIDRKNNRLFSCNDLQKGPVYIPDYIVTIDEEAFKGCRISEVIFSENSKLEGIGNNAFENCKLLTSINIPKNITYIDDEAFSGCHVLENLNLPAEIEELGDNVIEDCRSISSITIPEGITDIGGFLQGSRITSVTLPESLQKKPYFSECKDLLSIDYNGTIEQWKKLKVFVDKKDVKAYCSDGVIDLNDKTGETAKTNEEFFRKISVKAPEKTGDFVHIEKGSFKMGCEEFFPHSVSAEIPVIDVTLTRDYVICDHPVTQKEFKDVFGINPSWYVGEEITRIAAEGEIQENRPVEGITWYDAIVYCNKRSVMEGLTPCYKVEGITDWKNFQYSGKGDSIYDPKCPPSTLWSKEHIEWNAVTPAEYDEWKGKITCDFDADGYRLPTKAEWEYAARAGDYYVKEGIYSGTYELKHLNEYAWWMSNSSGKTHEVKKVKPNAYGLYDMCGNIAEMVWDRPGARYDNPAIDPLGQESEYIESRITCGGSYKEGYLQVKIGCYSSCGIGGRRRNDEGFRVVRTCKSGKK